MTKRKDGKPPFFYNYCKINNVYTSSKSTVILGVVAYA